jgi:hypothetical protein
MKINKVKDEGKEEGLEKSSVTKPESKAKSPYMSKGIYNNYARGMKEKNQKRTKLGLESIYIRTFEEWSSQ